VCPRCTDDPDFVDYWGYPCSANVGLDCSTFVDVFEYTAEQQVEVQLACPQACTDVAEYVMNDFCLGKSRRQLKSIAEPKPEIAAPKPENSEFFTFRMKE